MKMEHPAEMKTQIASSPASVQVLWEEEVDMGLEMQGLSWGKACRGGRERRGNRRGRQGRGSASPERKERGKDGTGRTSCVSRQLSPRRVGSGDAATVIVSRSSR